MQYNITDSVLSVFLPVSSRFLRMAYRAAASQALKAMCLIALSIEGVAQGFPPNPNNQNDIVLSNGPDVALTYSDPSIGPEVGTGNAAIYFASNDYFWKVYPRAAMHWCSGIAEISGLDMWDVDADLTELDVSGNNSALADMALTFGKLSAVQSGVIEPDITQPIVEISFGSGGPGKNNVFLTNPGCQPGVLIPGFEINVQIGTGNGDGILLPNADGSADFVLTTFVPGGGHTFSGPNACGNGKGKGSTPDVHSSGLAGAGETMYDVLGGGATSPYGGFAIAGAITGADGVHEIACTYLEFFDPVLVMHHNSATGLGPEEGTNGLHLDVTALGRTMGARIYAWQSIGKPAAITATIAPPLPTCATFVGGSLGLSPTDPLFAPFLNIWLSPPSVMQTDNGAFPTGTVFDDGTFTAPSIPLPPLPAGVSVPLRFQGFVRKIGGGVQSTQIWTSVLHG